MNNTVIARNEAIQKRKFVAPGLLRKLAMTGRHCEERSNPEEEVRCTWIASQARNDGIYYHSGLNISVVSEQGIPSYSVSIST